MESEFEKNLKRQPMQELPPEWRQEILAVAGEAGMMRRAARERRNTTFLQDWLVSLLWPYPKAWAGLAAVWVVIFGLQFAARDGSGSHATAKAAPPSAEMIAELKHQQRMFAELVGQREGAVAERPKSNSFKPRTMMETIMVV